MIFTTYWFLLFAALVIPVYWMLPKPGLRLGFLVLACLVFHAHFAGPAGMVPIIALMCVTYFLALSRRPWLCVLGISLSVATLCFYKYSIFLLRDGLALIRPQLAESLIMLTKKALPATPPLAVSFFAFEFVHYLYEVKKGGEPVRNPIKFLIFSIFFPSLVAGPIKRYSQFLPALKEGTSCVTVDDVSDGLRRIAAGFLKKVFIADNLTLYINYFQPKFDALNGPSRWAVFIAMGVRILMDFSGYSDIAIGLAKLLGIRLPENFNWPYLARSLQDFWQRWHISLSSWIRDYVYIPLGGNRLGLARRVLNGLVAFSLCGLWHGPAWHFVLWGIWHGVGLGVCSTYKAIPILGRKLESLLGKEPLVPWFLTQTFVFFGWLLFFYPASDAWHMAKRLFGV